jgi:hypothetical protein
MSGSMNETASRIWRDRLKISVFLCLIATLTFSAHSQTFSCPAGTEDMLSYFVMGYPNRVDHYMGPGNANPIYSSITPDLQASFAAQGYFVWTKGVRGYPWDIKVFDGNYVYDRSTELTWSDPTSFKRFSKDLPMSPRCVSTKKGTTNIKIPASGTVYGSYYNCTLSQTSNLNYVVNSISKPSMANAGGNLGVVQTRKFQYQYGCDSTYSNCTDMEVFSLGYQIGLYDWKRYIAQNGSWTLQQDSAINNLSAGQTTPDLPCPNSYQ